MAKHHTHSKAQRIQTISSWWQKGEDEGKSYEPLDHYSSREGAHIFTKGHMTMTISSPICCHRFQNTIANKGSAQLSHHVQEGSDGGDSPWDQHGQGHGRVDVSPADVADAFCQGGYSKSEGKGYLDVLLNNWLKIFVVARAAANCDQKACAYQLRQGCPPKNCWRNSTIIR